MGCPAGKFGTVLFGKSLCFDCDPGTSSAEGQTFCSHEMAVQKRAVKCTHVQCEFIKSGSNWRIRTVHHGHEALGPRHFCTHDAATRECTCKCYDMHSFETRAHVLSTA